MFLSTKSTGVRRLSLLAGLIGTGYRVVQPWGAFGPPSHNAWVNVANILIEAAFYFLVPWLAIRVVAWVVQGFVEDRH
jgi:hypothetical protein